MNQLQNEVSFRRRFLNHLFFQKKKQEASNIPTPKIISNLSSKIVTEEKRIIPARKINTENFLGNVSDCIQRKIIAIQDCRELLSEEDVTVPGIVVVGSQSSGKSSLLENLTGIELPRGETITTRVPLIIRMQQNNHLSLGESKIYISSTSDMKFSKTISEREILTNIEELTAFKLGLENKFLIADDPIYLKVEKKFTNADVNFNLMIIDTPGIAYNSADLKLSEQIEAMTKSLINKYISDKNYIIVAVIPAMDDIASHEILKMAQKHDPSQERTMGVLTKCDRIENGSSLHEKLSSMNNIKLRLGFHCIKNRSSFEIKQGMSLDDSRKLEVEFFKKDIRVRNVEYFGINNLITRLIALQNDIIKQIFPGLVLILSKKIITLKESINELPSELFLAENDHLKLNYFNRYILEITKLYEKIIKGELNNFSGSYKINKLHAKCLPRDLILFNNNLHKIFIRFCDDVEEALPNFLSNEYHETLSAMVNEQEGSTLANFLSHPVFKRAVREHFSIIVEEKSFDLLLKIKMAMIDMFPVMINIISAEFTEVPKLSGKIREEVEHLIQDKYNKTLNIIEAFTKSQTYYLFTVNPNYLSTLHMLRNKSVINELSPARVSNKLPVHNLPNLPGNNITDEFLNNIIENDINKFPIYEMQISLHIYIKSNINSLKDNIPKLIYYNFIHSINSDMIEYLQNNIVDNDIIELLKPDETQIKRRAELVNKFNQLQNILKILEQN